jgi:hypothetical protein
MQAIEFITDLSADPVLRIPHEAATQLPTSGRVRVIVLTAEADDDDVDWRHAAYEQFLRDDTSEDSIYDNWPSATQP